MEIEGHDQDGGPRRHYRWRTCAVGYKYDVSQDKIFRGEVRRHCWRALLLPADDRRGLERGIGCIRHEKRVMMTMAIGCARRGWTKERKVPGSCLESEKLAWARTFVLLDRVTIFENESIFFQEAHPIC